MFYVYIHLFNRPVNDLTYVSLQKHSALMSDFSVMQTFKTPEQPMQIKYSPHLHIQGEGGARPQSPPSEVKLKNTDFVDTIISSFT